VVWLPFRIVVSESCAETTAEAKQAIAIQAT
jgi:hypothetical protein